jgi:hypothetical protein
MKAKNIIPLLIKNVPFSEELDYEYYDIPSNESWIYEGEVIESICVEPTNEIKFVVTFCFVDGNAISFELNEEIDEETFRRFTHNPWNINSDDN